MRVLIVEDELKTADFLRKGLTAEGFVVDVEQNGQTGLDKALASEFDLMILDVMLPEKSGWSIITEVRRLGKQTPVLFLTARDLVQDRIKGLELGADDYLIKPFSFAELLTRIRTVLRRTSPRLSDIVQIGDLVIDLTRHRISRAGESIVLTTQEFALLSLLARRKGEVLSRQVISDQVWGMNFDTNTNVVDVAIRRLRSKIDDPYPVKLIHSIRGVGYVIDER